jgi:hypothetical protein
VAKRKEKDVRKDGSLIQKQGARIANQFGCQKATNGLLEHIRGTEIG